MNGWSPRVRPWRSGRGDWKRNAGRKDDPSRPPLSGKVEEKEGLQYTRQTFRPIRSTECSGSSIVVADGQEALEILKRLRKERN